MRHYRCTTNWASAGSRDDKRNVTNLHPARCLNGSTHSNNDVRRNASMPCWMGTTSINLMAAKLSTKVGRPCCSVRRFPPLYSPSFGRKVRRQRQWFVSYEAGRTHQSCKKQHVPDQALSALPPTTRRRGRHQGRLMNRSTSRNGHAVYWFDSLSVEMSVGDLHHIIALRWWRQAPSQARSIVSPSSSLAPLRPGQDAHV